MKRVYIADTSGNQYECELPGNTLAGVIAADFFEQMDWPQQDAQGRGQRAIIEFLNPQTREYTRLRPDQTIEDAQIPEGAILNIYPESIAGAVDARRRLAALMMDFDEIKELAASQSNIIFTSNNNTFPDTYDFRFQIDSFKAGPENNGEMPEIQHEHNVTIVLGSQYPREAPWVKWQTPIFHPNISINGDVCLGQLKERYLPSLGLKRIVLLLIEILQWRNYDFFEPFNQEAAQWAMQPENWSIIESIGGIKFHFPYKELINPENWGDTAKEGAIFKGTPQPDNLKTHWEWESRRPKIKFQRLTKQQSA